MNVKEVYEMIAYFKEKRDDAANMRELYQNKYTEKLEADDELNREYYRKEASSYGQDVARCDYFIRILEQIEVTR